VYPRAFGSEIGLFGSDAGFFSTSSRSFSAAREHCILCTYMYLCLYAYSTASFLCRTSMYLMCNTLNTMQHTTLRELHLVGHTLQHTATHCNTLQAPRKPHTATHCKYCDTSQHIAIHSSNLHQVNWSFTREHIVGAMYIPCI